MFLRIPFLIIALLLATAPPAHAAKAHRRIVFADGSCGFCQFREVQSEHCRQADCFKK